MGLRGYTAADRMKLSIVIPVCNEADNVEPLAREIHALRAALAPNEIIFVDDGSTDDTAAALARARAAGISELRVLQHARRCGQSTALTTGIRAAQAEWVVTMDGDGQNDPADIATLLNFLDEKRGAGHADLRLVIGHRRQRCDTWLRRVSSRIANAVRARLLGDGTPDAGCGLKLLHRETFLALPQFDHMHRFLPALFQRAGTQVMSVPVNHRPRTRGQSKYGVLNRLWVGIADLFGVRWLLRRRPPQVHVSEQ